MEDDLSYRSSAPMISTDTPTTKILDPTPHANYTALGLGAQPSWPDGPSALGRAGRGVTWSEHQRTTATGHFA